MHNEQLAAQPIWSWNAILIGFGCLSCFLNFENTEVIHSTWLSVPDFDSWAKMSRPQTVVLSWMGSGLIRSGSCGE